MLIKIWGLEGDKMKRKMVDAAEQISGQTSKMQDVPTCPILKLCAQLPVTDDILQPFSKVE